MLNKLAKNKQTKRIIILLLIFTLTFANWMVLGQSIATSIATNITENLDAQDAKTNQANVEFDAYFEQNKQKTHQISSCLNEEPILTLDVEVKNSGYLKDAKIELDGIGKSYEIRKAEEVQISDSIITLKQVNAGELLRISTQIGISLEDTVLLSKLNNISTVKLTGIYVDKEGKQLQIEKTIKIQIRWTDTAEVILSEDYTKYADYETDQAKGIILQSIYTVERNEEKTNLPIEETNLLVQVPEIEGKKLIDVEVNSTNTSGTNGKKLETVTFGQENWKYNQNENTVSITVKNEGTNVWSGKGKDEYLVTYVYENESQTEDDVLILTNKAVASIKEYNKTEKITASLEEEKKVSKTAEIVTTQLETNMQEISKGKLYANHITKKDKYEINYETKAIVNIPYAQAIKENINIEMIQDKFIDKEEKTLDKQNISYYKSTKIAKKNFDKILGEAGYIRILNGEVEIARIDSGSIEDENGNYKIIYTENFANLKIETSIPISEGDLIITNEKKLNNEIKYTNEEITSIAKIETKINNNTEQINLTETNSGISVEIDKTNLSSIAVNKNVTIKIKLNNKDENTLLYKEPEFDIVLPENIADIQIMQSEILYSEGLTIANVQKDIVKNKPTIRIKLEGTQEEFSNGVLTNGTNIILKADITLKTLCPNTKENLSVNYTNNNPIAALLGVNLGTSKTDINLIAPEEVISYQTIKTDVKGNEISSINEGKVAGKINIFEKEQTKQMELTVLNNYKTAIGNIAILGRIPCQGKTPEGIDLGSTFDTTLKTAISGSNTNASIYYSENANATKTLDETWKKAENSDLSKVKSYLIVFPDDYILSPAEKLNFTYDFEIPANLEHSNEVYGEFTTYYNKIDGENKIAETSVTELVGLTTGEGPRLKLELSTNIAEGTLVREGQIISYTAKVTNTGKSTAENIVVKVPVPDNIDYVEYNGEKYSVNGAIKEKQFTIQELETGKEERFTMYAQIRNLPTLEEFYGDLKQDEKGYYLEKTEKYELTEVTPEQKEQMKLFTVIINEQNYYVKTLSNEELKKLIEVAEPTYENEKIYLVKTDKQYVEENIPIANTAKLEAEKLEKEISSNEVVLKAVKSDIQIITHCEKNSLTNTIRENEIVKYHVLIKNNSEKVLNNIELSVKLNEALQYNGVYILTKKGEKEEVAEEKINDAIYNNNTLQYTIPTLEVGQSIQIRIDTTTKSLEEEYQKDIVITPEVKVNSVIYTANPIENKIARAKLLAKQESSAENTYIKEGDIYTYTMTVENQGNNSTKNFKVKLNFPKELTIKEMYYVLDGNKIEMAYKNSFEMEYVLKPKQTIKIVAKVQVKKLEQGITEKNITNSFILTEAGRTIDINSINHTIELNPNYVPEGPTEPEEPTKPETKTYKISGTAWIDENKNGQMDNSEQKLKGIEVHLINTEGKTIGTVTTDENGQYIFKDLSKGKYIVAFKYDNEVYNLTDYKKSGVSDSINSDVIGTQGTAITDNIEISDTSIGNINMGLVLKEIFDLKLDKYVSKIVVQTVKGTKEYNYEKETLGKLEIRAKELKGAKVMMEYEIVITNEGKTAGYAKEIVDYIPSNTLFSSELNPGWYLGSDNNLHTTQLKDVLIQPGESKTLKVVLSRTMTEQNTGTVNNRAEIAKSYNQELIEDKDSIAGNKANGEDDIGSADIIIGVATGAEVIYITLGIVCMIILATGTYVIKRKVLGK